MAEPRLAPFGEYEHIIIVLTGMSESGKTALFDVIAKRGNTRLGRIKWFGRWRQYTFYPDADTTYSEGCLTDIADFLNAARTKQLSLNAQRRRG